MIDRICTSLDKLDGAFAFLIMVDNRIYAARDKYGLRPYQLNFTNGCLCVCIRNMRIRCRWSKICRDVEPGEIIRVKDGKLLSKIYTKIHYKIKYAMEYIYFSRPDSNLDGINVHTTRKLAGKQLYYEKSYRCRRCYWCSRFIDFSSNWIFRSIRNSYEMGLVKINMWVEHLYNQLKK